MSNISYKDAGVDIDAGNQFVEAIKADVKSTFDKNVIDYILFYFRASLPH